MERSTTYLLKVWQPEAGGFRAHLRAVDQESALGFDTPHALAEHLLAHVRLAKVPAEPPSAAKPCDERRGDALSF